MNCITPKKRTDGRSSFLQLVAYISVRDENSPSDEVKNAPTPNQRATTKAKLFNRLIDYIERTPIPESDVILEEFPDGRQRVKCGEVVCETNCFSLETASAEMNFVAGQSTRCEDPVYHFILSWREEDNPRDSDIFECVTHSLEKLGMAEHQYVSAIHRDTDNVHVHVAVNRVNPQTYKAASLWKNYDTLQKCCRELEARYGYTPDNGSWVRNEQNEIVRA
ncbi:relaxase/mobilization nuclease domain-containing protein, partial [Serratia ureilytica]|uniref:relaxase/mobilization nuclease domain-containing protein n=1 Tax=Serratia ureilytica TaxID=300181 RepID=UPI001AA0DCD9